MLDAKQRGVLRGMAAALALAVVALGAAVTTPPAALLPAAPFPATLAVALGWSLLPVACLGLNIGALARHRFFTPADIDGSGLSAGTATARTLQAILQNTLEQAALAVCVYAAWAALMPLAWQAVVPAAALLFGLGRLLFWRGYAAGAPARAFGFGLTFYPSMLMLAALALRLALGTAR